VLARIIRGALDHPRLIAAASLILLLYGGLTLPSVKLDIFPSLSPAVASVETEGPGMVAEQVEQLLTRPVEAALIGTAGVAAVHSTSVQGLSIVTLDLQTGADPDRVRQAITERLAQAASGLPAGAGPPRLSPLTSTGADSLKIGFTSARLTPMALRSIVQWTVRPRLLSVPGVANVQVFGGEVRRIEVRARSGDLSDSDLGYADVFDAVRRATGVTGAGFIDTPAQRVLIDPRGQALSLDDIAAGQIQIVGSAPTRISDVADVVDAPAPPIGDALIMGKPAVVLAIGLQHGANTLEATRGVDAAVALLAPVLAGLDVRVDADLDRPATFIAQALREVIWSLFAGVALVAVLLVLALRDGPAALVSIVSIALSFCAALLAVKLLGWTLNTMTLGGLAVALGLVVDDAVIDVESMLRRLRDADARHASRAEALLTASLEVRAPVIYATALIIVGLLPITVMGGVSGELVRPLAVSIIVASAASLVVAVIVTPALAILCLNHIRPDRPFRFADRLAARYDRVLQRAARAPGGLALAVLGLLLIIALAGFASFKVEPLPNFHNGHLTAEITAPASTSIAVMRDYGARITRDLTADPRIQSVSEQIGRAQTGDSAFGPEHAQFDIELKPDLATAAQDAVEREARGILDAYPGLHGYVRTPLAAQVQGSAERGQLVARVYGDDLDAVDRTAGQVAAALSKTPGARGATTAVGAAAPAVRIDLNFQRLAIFGLSAADVLDTVQTAFQGRQAAQIYENGRAIDVAVTAQAGLRQDPESVGDLLLRSSSGISVPLRSVANVYLAEGRTAIRHDNGVRSQSVFTDTSGDLRDFVRRARDEIAKTVTLPAGVYLEFSTPDEAGARRDLLAGAVVAGGAMLALLLLAFGSLRASMMIVGTTAFAFIGGVVAVAVTGGVLSLGALVGFVALFGLSTRSAILLISRINDLTAGGRRSWSAETARLAARQRIWPILVSALLVAAAVAPLAVRAGRPGQEILGPMAIVILCGLATSTVLSLLFSPSLALRILRPKPSGAEAAGRSPGGPGV